MNFIKSQKYEIKILNSFGFFIFDAETLKISTKRRIYCFILNIGLTIHFLISSYIYTGSYNEFLMDNSNVTYCIHLVEVLANIFMKFIVLYSTLLQYEHQLDFLKLFAEIELKISRMRFSKAALEDFYQSLKVSSLISIVIYLIFFGILEVFYATLLMESEPISHIFQSATFLVLTFSFVILTAFIGHQVQTLGKFLSIIKANLRHHISLSSHFELEIKEIFQLIYDLRVLIEIWNEFYGVLIFGTFVFVLGVFSSEVYFFFVTFHFSNLIHASPLYFLYDLCNLVR